MTDTDCLRNCPPSSHAPDFPLNERVLFPSRPCLCRRSPGSLISRCESRVASLSRKIFSPSDGAGACLGVEIPPGKCGRRLRGSGAAIFWILEIMGLRSLWEPGEREEWSVEGGGSIGVGVTSALLSSHPPHPCSRPGSVLFCIIIIIITRVSHRPASSDRVTGAREPVPKQYQENKSEDQL